MADGGAVSLGNVTIRWSQGGHGLRVAAPCYWGMEL